MIGGLLVIGGLLMILAAGRVDVWEKPEDYWTEFVVSIAPLSTMMFLIGILALVFGALLLMVLP